MHFTCSVASAFGKLQTKAKLTILCCCCCCGLRHQIENAPRRRRRPLGKKQQCNKSVTRNRGETATGQQKNREGKKRKQEHCLQLPVEQGLHNARERRVECRTRNGTVTVTGTGTGTETGTVSGTVSGTGTGPGPIFHDETNILIIQQENCLAWLHGWRRFVGLLLKAYGPPYVHRLLPLPLTPLTLLHPPARLALMPLLVFGDLLCQ